MARPTSTTQSPILVTGCPRSGTTWVGSTLGASSRILFIYEPFNTDASRNLGVSPRFIHLTSDNAERYRDAIESLIDLADWKTRVRRCVLGAPTVRRPGAKLADRLAIATLVESPATFAWANRVCIKDPLAFFSAEWLADTFDMKVVVLLRHPAGVISSYLKLGWKPEVEPLLRQPSLKAQFLEFTLPEIADYLRNKDDLLQGHIVQWKIFARAALQLRRTHPDWLFVRHEDLCHQPLENFRLICDYAGVSWTKGLQRKVRHDSSSQNEADPATPRQHALRRASGSLPDIWRERLDTQTIDRINRETEGLWKQVLAIPGRG